MKKYLILSLSIVALGAMSCKKCQTCTTTVTQDVGGVSVNVSAVDEEYCGDAYDDAPGNTSVTQDVGGVIQTVTISCVDN